MTQEEKMRPLTATLFGMGMGIVTEATLTGNVLEAVCGGKKVTALIQLRPNRDFLKRIFSLTDDVMRTARAVKATFILVQNTDNPLEIIACPVTLEARQKSKLRPLVSYDECGERIFTYVIR